MNCNFCGKHQDNVHLLVAGPNVYICDECISICVDVVEEQKQRKSLEKFKRSVFSEYWGTDI